MSSRPWMPLYIADYRGDTAHLSTEQDGAYLLLLMAMWTAGGKLPNNDKTLARICKATSRRWRDHIRESVMPFFAVVGDTIVQRRLKQEIEKLDELTEKRSEAGRQGGRPKKAIAFEDDKKATAKQPVQRSLFGAEKEPAGAANPLENNDQGKARLSDSRAPASSTPTPTVSSIEETPRPNGRVATQRSPISEAKEAWDDLAERCNLSKVVLFTPERRKKLKAILDHYGIDRWKEALSRIEESDFCRGLIDGRGWKADFDFAVRPSSFAKLLEGRYDNRVESTARSPPAAYGSPAPPDDDEYSEANLLRIAAKLEAKYGKK